MSQHLGQPYESWIGRTVKDPAGQRVGKVEDIYTDDDSGLPEWLAVASPGGAAAICFLPVADASWDDDDEDLWVPIPRGKVREAPIAAANGRLSREEVTRLRAYYGREPLRRAARRRMAATEWVSLVAASDEEQELQPSTRTATDQPAPPPRRAASERVLLSASFDEAPAGQAQRPLHVVDLPARPRQRAVGAAVTVSAFVDEARGPRPPDHLDRDEPAPAVRPIERGRVTLSASFDQEPAAPPDSPLTWNHDERIDSIRPPVNRRHALPR